MIKGGVFLSSIRLQMSQTDHRARYKDNQGKPKFCSNSIRTERFLSVSKIVSVEPLF